MAKLINQTFELREKMADIYILEMLTCDVTAVYSLS